MIDEFYIGDVYHKSYMLNVNTRKNKTNIELQHIKVNKRLEYRYLAC